MAAEHVIMMNNEEMEKIAEKDCALVDFYATWCGPCRMMAPVIDELADEYAGRVTVGKLNIDEFPDMAEKYRIVSIPTLILFKNGSPEEVLVGVTSKSRLEELIDSYL